MSLAVQAPRTGARVSPARPPWSFPRVTPVPPPAAGGAAKGAATVPPPRVGGAGAVPFVAPSLSRPRGPDPIRAGTHLRP
ncbi:hypothetical protein GCM10018785_20470 [Streptomyces longispororuber]|uniref:Uncharacterized protein n=1 Tax=Streptomyces longispororuber TaxID=68230 RepID=A0A919DJC0_9ACTN|nr:hypothetical protein GCM10018785_20470 [Streptomyces longispororuber]